MSTKDNNKLDEIKIKLEKKLAAIEAKKKEKVTGSIEKKEEVLIEKQHEEEKNKKLAKPPLKSSDSEVTKIKNSKSKVIPLKQEKVKPITKEEENKKGYLIYFIYLFILFIFSAIIYFSMDYMGENKNLQKDIMHQRLSEFKNKYISDSIETANLDNRVLDLQSKKMFDSISKAYEDELIAEARKMSSTVITKNYDFVDYKKKDKNDNIIIKNTIATTGKNASQKSDVNTIVTPNNIAGNTSDTPSIDDKLRTKAADIVTGIVANINIDPIKNNQIDKVTSEVEKPAISVEKKASVIKSPIYPGCEKKKTEHELKKCLHNKMYKHITKKFDKSIAQNTGLSEGLHQVRVTFLVDVSGYATVLDVKAENEALENEATRVVQTLPKMEPGVEDGRLANTLYTIPITFMIKD